MIALLRYEGGLLFRSHRWVLPLVGYALLLSVGAAGAGRQSVGDGLDWSAAILVAAVAVLTRSMLTAEPAATRACVATAAGPARAQLAALLTAFTAGVVLGLLGAGYEVLTSSHQAGLLAPLATGLVTALVCVLVGSAVGTLFNPPLIRHPAMALLTTIGAIVLAWAARISPANAALRSGGAAQTSAAWPTGAPFAAALVLVAASWAVSCWLAGRRGD
ncbi:MAG: hypothetical protein J2P29_02845 [Actinobacteria bacterium]|nr:hypothetical protein [Actinomycetota bacterium]